MVKVSRFGLQQLEILKKERNLLAIMALALIKILSSFHVNADLKIVVDTLLELSLDGELIKNFQWLKKN